MLGPTRPALIVSFVYKHDDRRLAPVVKADDRRPRQTTYKVEKDVCSSIVRNISLQAQFYIYILAKRGVPA